MSGSRPLRGGCQCGRNRYIIAIPENGIKDAQVLFNTEPQHQIPLATPLAAYIRVPLSWYHSSTYAFFPDETHTMIRRVYSHPSQDYSKRHFCGFCGTPLSYWSEEPRSEAEFINLTLGSLLREDIRDLEDMGLIPEDEGSPPKSEAAPATPTRRSAIQQSFGVPWFDGLIEGSRLGSMRRSYGAKRSRDGQTSIEWDIVEYSENGGGEMDQDEPEAEVSTQLGKRKLRDHEV
ncbi:uncharacterized protein TRIVIDRAFT_75197 [Trichoderma virens Gv29-8]|uniref:CENP-V/GFA domain-containing protein n=1 Tax=Hypocrea virens (strain Gv29-8 / FGSC 10586) TaxID=413071 RepID=G9N9T5_HYPVG|nr:uncharacterized protein TRIVIDRAFT_75197 [Trichoderma virens Gv29-8]EHK16703.1 hypothetical protein TRIVIDRAFT_75197 [Trichoderma virens Gv29-8]UKZ51918.1 hypothetical protein TrVGV298_005684 [Trichoderma virens]UKZ77741.1 hypothetical protein TrVFT333_005466 [Trichoderma virens FT-333]